VLVYLAVPAVLGIANMARHPEIISILNPGWAVNFFLIDHALAFLALGSVVLAVTGAEALYADMGHFGRRRREPRKGCSCPNWLGATQADLRYVQDIPAGNRKLSHKLAAEVCPEWRQGAPASSPKPIPRRHRDEQQVVVLLKDPC
jgi:hypothetical protein